MDDAGLDPLDLLRQHGLQDAREVHTYLGSIDGLGQVRLRILDRGATAYQQDHRWTVEVYDQLDAEIAHHIGERLPFALTGAFQTIRDRIG